MDYKRTASEVLKHVGGRENVTHFEHCSTRLRFSLKDDKKADVPTLENIEGVMAVKMGSQCQVVIGNDVIEVYDEVVKLLGKSFADDEASGTQTNEPAEKKKWSAVFLDFLTGVFGPLIPAIAGGGVLKSLLLLLSVLGWMNPDGQTYKILFLVGDAPLYFLPLLVAITTANKLKVNSLVALSAVGAMLLPKMSTLLTDGAELIGFSVRNISYSYQVFPAILTVLLYAQLEKGFTKISPKVIRVFFVPMMSLLITVPTSLLLLGPIGYTLGEGFTKVILFVFSTVGWVAVALLAALLPLIVSIGMHKALIPYVINALGTSGKELLYNPASLAHNISESGACFAIAIRTKDKRLRATAISAGISALFGITEPALYGVTLQHKKVLWSVMSGAFVGGAFVGIVGLQSFVAVGPGLASLSMFVSADLPRNIVNAIIGLLIAFVVAFVVALALFKDKSTEALERSAEEKSNAPVRAEREQRKLAGTLQASETFKSPAIGEQIPLSQVNDEVFSTKAMGEGIAIVPSVGELYAPVDGKIEMVFGKKHAIAMSTAGGAELLFHVGIDTVRLKGKHFDPQVQAGDIVKAGDLLMKFDFEQIAAEGYDPVVLTIVTSKDKYAVDVANLKKVGRHDTLMTVTALTH